MFKKPAWTGCLDINKITKTIRCGSRSINCQQNEGQRFSESARKQNQIKNDSKLGHYFKWVTRLQQSITFLELLKAKKEVICSPWKRTQQKCPKIEIHWDSEYYDSVYFIHVHASIWYLPFSTGSRIKGSAEPEINRRRYALVATNTATINHLAAVIPSIDASVPPART